MSQVEIRLGQAGQNGVTVDGQRLTSVVGLFLSVGLHDRPKVSLELRPASFTIEVDGEVRLNEETMTLLRRLGWTPPLRLP